MAKPKNPFQIQMKISNELNPHTGQIATSKDMTATTPTTAPMGISLGLYYSTWFTPKKTGSINEI